MTLGRLPEGRGKRSASRVRRQAGDPSVTLDLQAVFDRCYDAGPYSREIRYGVDAVLPPLDPGRAAWADRAAPAGA
ncbi:MAG: DUF4058 family protein [Isosphaeraceae bacterium]